VLFDNLKLALLLTDLLVGLVEQVLKRLFVVTEQLNLSFFEGIVLCCLLGKLIAFRLNLPLKILDDVVQLVCLLVVLHFGCSILLLLRLLTLGSILVHLIGKVVLLRCNCVLLCVEFGELLVKRLTGLLDFGFKVWRRWWFFDDGLRFGWWFFHGWGLVG
jgi:hypothetical protein